MGGGGMQTPPARARDACRELAGSGLNRVPKHDFTRADRFSVNALVAAAPLDVRKACGFVASGQPKCFTVEPGGRKGRAFPHIRRRSRDFFTPSLALGNRSFLFQKRREGDMSCFLGVYAASRGSPFHRSSPPSHGFSAVGRPACGTGPDGPQRRRVLNTSS
jgi:hypothetical protein